MTLPAFTMRQLLEAGVHFGHSTRRWNPKMAPYLFGVRNGIHIIDLQQTVPMLHRAMGAVRDVVAGGGRVLFVGTKRQASESVAEAAKRCGQYYVNHRWLGGTMTNWQTISKSIKHLHVLDDKLDSEASMGLTKKELLRLTRQRDKLERALGGIKEMGGLPDILVVIDTNKEAIAVAEANKLGIPVVGVIDSNSDINGIDYPIPGNDDAIRAINVYCELMAATVIEGIQAEMAAAGADVGESEEGPVEKLPAEASKTAAAEPAAEEKTAAAEPAAGEKTAAAEPPAEEKAAEKTSAAEPAVEEKTAAAEPVAEEKTAGEQAENKPQSPAPGADKQPSAETETPPPADA